MSDTTRIGVRAAGWEALDEPTTHQCVGCLFRCNAWYGHRAAGNTTKKNDVGCACRSGCQGESAGQPLRHCAGRKENLSLAVQSLSRQGWDGSRARAESDERPRSGTERWRAVLENHQWQYEDGDADVQFSSRAAALASRDIFAFRSERSTEI